MVALKPYLENILEVSKMVFLAVKENLYGMIKGNTKAHSKKEKWMEREPSNFQMDKSIRESGN